MLVKILPPPWGLPGAIWRLTPSHQPIGALDPPVVTSVSAPNTRFLIYGHCGGGPGGASRPPGPGLPGRGWVPGGVGFEAVPGGVLTGSTNGARGRPEERRPGGQKVASKAWHCRGRPAEVGMERMARGAV
jgi:hypothetical protein